MLIVGSVSDDPFAIDVAHFFGQQEEISDVVSLKRFANTEFCPRFISDENDLDRIGRRLAGRTVVIVSTCCADHTRNALAMRTCLVARAAKDNGAERVVCVEPDLFYSAQDRGPRPEHGDVDFHRDAADYKKFDGQPFSSRLYAQFLRTSGVDVVVTLHNHSVSVQRLFSREFGGQFYNLSPASLYAHYLVNHDVGRVTGRAPGFVLCAPDAGARRFVNEVRAELDDLLSGLLLRPAVHLLEMAKERSGERNVVIRTSANSPSALEDVRDMDVVVCDDMVRTGATIVGCCRLLKEAGARRVVFVVTHFHSSDEVKENLNSDAIDEIVTTNSLPAILNRDMQGRLRRKMLVLKIEKWLASFLRNRFSGHPPSPDEQLYAIDISSKNPRWRPHEHL